MRIALGRALFTSVLLATALAAGATACGSLDIDALGAGLPDAGDLDGPGPGANDGGPGGDASNSAYDGDSASVGDGAWNPSTTEDGGTWVPAGWQKMTSSSNQVLRAVWGATSTSVWAGGEQGTLLFFDGVAWSSRASSLSPQGVVWAIHGSAADDVYLLEYRSNGGQGAMHLHHFDGGSWTEGPQFPFIGQVGCINVPTRGIVYVYGATKAASAGLADVLQLYRVVGNSVVGRQSLSATSFLSASGDCSVHAFSPSDVWISGTPVSRFDGTGFVPLPGTPPSSDVISVIATNQAFTRLHVWNGAAWQGQTTGVAGALGRVTGRTTAQAFGIVNGAAPHVVKYASGSWTEETIPASADLLNDVWMAPNGRTFAVGYGGAILTGP